MIGVGALAASSTATATETSRSTSDSGASRAVQSEARSSEDACFCPRSIWEMYPRPTRSSAETCRSVRPCSRRRSRRTSPSNRRNSAIWVLLGRERVCRVCKVTVAETLPERGLFPTNDPTQGRQRFPTRPLLDPGPVAEQLHGEHGLTLGTGQPHEDRADRLALLLVGTRDTGRRHAVRRTGRLAAAGGHRACALPRHHAVLLDELGRH